MQQKLYNRQRREWELESQPNVMKSGRFLDHLKCKSENNFLNLGFFKEFNYLIYLIA